MPLPGVSVFGSFCVLDVEEALRGEVLSFLLSSWWGAVLGRWSPSHGATPGARPGDLSLRPVLRVGGSCRPVPCPAHCGRRPPEGGTWPGAAYPWAWWLVLVCAAHGHLPLLQRGPEWNGGLGTVSPWSAPLHGPGMWPGPRASARPSVQPVLPGPRHPTPSAGPPGSSGPCCAGHCGPLVARTSWSRWPVCLCPSWACRTPVSRVPRASLHVLGSWLGRACPLPLALGPHRCHHPASAWDPPSPDPSVLCGCGTAEPRLPLGARGPRCPRTPVSLVLPVHQHSPDPAAWRAPGRRGRAEGQSWRSPVRWPHGCSHHTMTPAEARCLPSVVCAWRGVHLV